jgi:drug/metabolite transporter superfamily protein YnfA
MLRKELSPCHKLKHSNIHIFFNLMQGCNARKVNCGRVYSAYVHIETSSLWAEFVNKNRCISVCLVSEEVKSIC